MFLTRLTSPPRQRKNQELLLNLQVKRMARPNVFLCTLCTNSRLRWLDLTCSYAPYAPIADSAIRNTCAVLFQNFSKSLLITAKTRGEPNKNGFTALKIFCKYQRIPAGAPHTRRFHRGAGPEDGGQKTEVRGQILPLPAVTAPPLYGGASLACGSGPEVGRNRCPRSKAWKFLPRREAARSKDWKKIRFVFQTLEEIFPRVGKLRPCEAA